MARIDFQTDPRRYRHWKPRFDGPVAHLILDVALRGRLHLFFGARTPEELS